MAGYEVIRGGQGYSTRKIQPGDIVIKKVSSGGGSSRSGSSSSSVSYPSVRINGTSVFINGVGYSVALDKQAEFIQQQTGGRGSSAQNAINTARQNAIKEAQRQAQLKAQQEANKLKQILSSTRQSTILQNKIQQAQAEAKKRQQQANQLQKEISQLEQARKDASTQSITEEAYKKILADKKAKESQLFNLTSGITAYNNKVNLEVNKAQAEFNKYINNEAKKLQAQVDSGSISVSSANSILESRASSKQQEINKKLNEKISTFKVPDALKTSVNTVEAVEVPKTKIGKVFKKYDEWVAKKKNELGIIGLSEGFEKRITEIGKIKKGNIGQEALIGASIGALSFGKGIIDIPKTIRAFVQNPSLIKQLSPSNLKIRLSETGETLKLSPTRTIARIGTELYLMFGTGRVLKVNKEVTGIEKANLLTKLKQAGQLSRIEIKFIKGKVPKIEFRIKSIAESIKPVTTSRNINAVARDIAKLIPKTVSKIQVSKATQSMKPIIRSFLKDKRVIEELARKYPNKIKFTLKEIKSLRSYAKLRTAIKRDVFEKASIKAIRQTAKKVKVGKRTIKGVKVSRKEFRSFQEADIEFRKLKRLGKFVKKIENKGGVGRIETLPKRPINVKELEYFKVIRKIPRQILANVKNVETNTFVQKFSARIPVIKRFGNAKKGYWRTILQDKEFYQNSVSFSLYNKTGKPLGTITFNTLSSKPLTRFRSLTNALKWGTNKNIILSKSVGKNFVRSFVLKARGRKITAREFLSKIKVTSKGDFQDILIYTKKIPKYTQRKNIKKQFKGAIPVSATKGRIRKIKQPLISKINRKKGMLEIVQRGKTVKMIKTKSIINPVIIDTSKIDTVIRQLESIKIKTLSKGRIKRLKQLKRMVAETKGSRPFKLNGKKKVIISKAKLQQLNKISKETRALKESLAGRSITPRIKITKRVQGIKKLKQLRKVESDLKKVRAKLISRKALDVASKTAISQALLLSNKFKNKLKQGQALLMDQQTKQIQASIQKSLLKSKSKTVLKTIKALEVVMPILILTPMVRSIRPRVPKTKAPKIPIRSKKKIQEESFKTFSKPVKIFSVIVKKRGRAVLLKNGLTEKDALNFMSYELDTQLLRSARLKQTGTSKKARKLSPKYNGAFEKRKKKLRQYKIKQKKKLPIRGFIEKKRFALDTPTERAQLRGTKKKASSKKTKSKRKLTPSQKKILLQRLKKARAVRMRNLKKRSVKKKK